MTPTQISALIFLILSAALLYWLGNRNGLADGRRGLGQAAEIAGAEEGVEALEDGIV